MKFDDLFEYIGEIGTFQLFVATILFLSAIFGSDSILQNFVGGSTVEHWCHVPELEEFPHDQQRYVAIPRDDDGNYYSCWKYDLDYGSLSVEDILTWDRNAMVDNDTSTIECTNWVYDKTKYANTLRSNVSQLSQHFIL